MANKYVKFFIAFSLGILVGIVLSQFLPQSSQKLQGFPSQVFNLQPTSLHTETASIASSRERGTISRVVDGDTVETSDGRRVRYIGINTPETVDPRRPVECFGREASAKNKELVLGKEVYLEKDISNTDRYGRLLRYVYVTHSNGQEVMVNEVLVREGYASVSTFPPDVKYVERFKQAEREAQEQGKGLWSRCPVNKKATTISTSSATQNTGCVIKGNISSGGKIYHLPGCGSYEKTTIDESAGEHWFCTEQEAVIAGWRKAKNC